MIIILKLQKIRARVRVRVRVGGLQTIGYSNPVPNPKALLQTMLKITYNCVEDSWGRWLHATSAQWEARSCH
jgi:hypothetical protein